MTLTMVIIPWSTQPGHPSVGRCNEYSQKAVMLCGCRVKACMVCVWMTG